MQRTASSSSPFNRSWLPAAGGLSVPAIPFSTAASHAMCRSWALSRFTVKAEVLLTGQSTDLRSDNSLFRNKRLCEESAWAVAANQQGLHSSVCCFP